LLALALGLVFFFPSLRREEIELRTEIERPKCVERLEIRLFKGEELQRANSELVDGRDLVVQRTKLSHGEYRAVVNLACTDGSTAIASRQPIVVDREGVIEFNVSGRECRCSER
jgi:hypothetical protein